MDLRDIYHLFLGELQEHYGLHIDKMTDIAYEASEGIVPLFQVIYGRRKDEALDHIFLSFHLDMDPLHAVQWFLRARTIYPDVGLAQSYYKDDYGECYLGDQALALKFYKEQQMAIQQWNDLPDEEKVEPVGKITGRARPDATKNYIDPKEALAEFNKMRLTDEDKYH